MMKVMVTGGNGQLGYDVCKRLDQLDIENKGVDLADFDLTDSEQTERAILAYRPDCVVHCAAYTAVDAAESNREACMRINVDGTRNLARACRQCDAAMAYISTDYVFSGEGEKPFETDDPKAPQNVYGESKLLGEQAMLEELPQRIYIIRTSWVYGLNGKNFVKTMLRLGAEKDEIRVVCDQIGSPTYTVDLAAALCDLLEKNAYGVYHCTNEGFCSWYEFTKEIMRLSSLKTKIIPVATVDYPTAAKRPLNSRLSKISLNRAGVSYLPDWKDAIERYIVELTKTQI